MRLFKNLFKKRTIFLIHSGDFHADDVFAAATFSLWTEKRGMEMEVKRSRNEKEIETADIVADVGGVYNSSQNKFDHHQKGGAGIRENGIPYASFGLVWKKYGEEICGSREIADRIEKKIVMPIDARDNGINISESKIAGLEDYRISNVVNSFNISWEEEGNDSEKLFKRIFNFAKEILKREIIWAEALIDGEKETNEIILNQNEPEILVLNEHIEWEEAVSKCENIKFVVYPGKDEWKIQTGTNNLEGYHSFDRAVFPENWRGLRGKELAEISGIRGAKFCINGGWFAIAETKEGAVEMAKKALQISKI